MALWTKLKFWETAPGPTHLKRGSLGETAARDFLRRKGLKFLTANFAGKRGEVDLIFRDGECLVFVEVKTRSGGGWTRPSRAVDARKRRAIFRTATDYLRLLGTPQVPYRFDVIEVLLEGENVREIRHLENSFNSTMIRVPRQK
jgi:putative endonuclease